MRRLARYGRWAGIGGITATGIAVMLIAGFVLFIVLAGLIFGHFMPRGD